MFIVMVIFILFFFGMGIIIILFFVMRAFVLLVFVDGENNDVNSLLFLAEVEILMTSDVDESVIVVLVRINLRRDFYYYQKFKLLNNYAKAYVGTVGFAFNGDWFVIIGCVVIAFVRWAIIVA